jgi:hypothetical protein
MFCTIATEIQKEIREWRMENGEWRMENGEWRMGL